MRDASMPHELIVSVLHALLGDQLSMTIHLFIVLRPSMVTTSSTNSIAGFVAVWTLAMSAISPAPISWTSLPSCFFIISPLLMLALNRSLLIHLPFIVTLREGMRFG